MIPISHEMSNTNTENSVVTKVENKINTSTNISTNKNLPNVGIEDNNTFILVCLILLGISSIFYIKYITLKIKEN